MECENKGCDNVAIQQTPDGKLCYQCAHDWWVKSRVRSNNKRGVYRVQSESDDGNTQADMFEDNPRAQLKKLTNDFLNNLSVIAADEE